MKLFANKKNVILFAAVFFIVILTLIFIGPGKESTLCHNNVQDHGETGIDCGGACDASCHEVKRLETKKTFIINSGNQKNSGLAVLVKNPNDLYGLSNFSYDIIGYDENSEEVVRGDGQSYILPKQEKYLSILGIDETLIDRIISVSIEMQKESWNKFSQFTDPNLFVINKKFEDAGESLIVVGSGRLANNSAYNVGEINIVAVIFDEKGGLRALTSTNINDIESGERRDFKVSWVVDRQNGDRLEMFPETDVFQESGFAGEFGLEEVLVRYVN